MLVNTEDLVSLKDIAKRFGVSSATASNWASGFNFKPDATPFPKPVVIVGKTAVFHWPSVKEWFDNRQVNKGGAPQGNTNNDGVFHGNQHTTKRTDRGWYNG